MKVVNDHNRDQVNRKIASLRTYAESADTFKKDKLRETCIAKIDALEQALVIKTQVAEESAQTRSHVTEELNPVREDLQLIKEHFGIGGSENAVRNTAEV